VTPSTHIAFTRRGFLEFSTMREYQGQNSMKVTVVM
jgi:hypothetical protein